MGVTNHTLFLEIQNALHNDGKQQTESYRYIYLNVLEAMAKKEEKNHQLGIKWHNLLPHRSAQEFASHWIAETMQTDEFLEKVQYHASISKEVESIENFYALEYPAILNKKTGEIVRVKEGHHWPVILKYLENEFGHAALDDASQFEKMDAWIAKNICIKGGYFEDSFYSLYVRSPKSSLYANKRR